MALFSRVGAELMRMYFKYTRIKLRCEVVFMMRFNHCDIFQKLHGQTVCMMLINVFGAELMVLFQIHYNSHALCRYFMMLLHGVGINYAVELFL